jgi:hypothetical protein
MRTAVLPVAIKLDLLCSMLAGKSMDALLAPLSEAQLLEAHRFIWEKTVEFGIKIRGKKFPLDELQAALRALAEVQISRDCPAQVKQCRLTECASRHPQCMRRVATEQILGMSQAIHDYLR